MQGMIMIKAPTVSEVSGEKAEPRLYFTLAERGGYTIKEAEDIAKAIQQAARDARAMNQQVAA